MSFYDEIKRTNWTEIEREIEARTEADVESALRAVRPGGIDLDHFMSLLSPAAEYCLEEMARHAHLVTQSAVRENRFPFCAPIRFELLHSIAAPTAASIRKTRSSA